MIYKHTDSFHDQYCGNPYLFPHCSPAADIIIIAFVQMPRNKTTSITPDGQADADRERPVTVPTKGKKTAGRANKGKAKSASARDTPTAAEVEIAELKGDSCAHLN
jgi:hypothetical protein